MSYIRIYIYIYNLPSQQQLKAMDRDLEHLKFREEEAREVDTVMLQLRDAVRDDPVGRQNE